DGKTRFEQLASAIEVVDVDFNYGNTSILSNINLHILKNQSVAFVGESGSGKTTLVNLIAGLLPADKGTLLINGIDLKQLNRQSYQKRIGYITQDPVIFNDTIFNNVTFWAEPTTKNVERFEQAIQQA